MIFVKTSNPVSLQPFIKNLNDMNQQLGFFHHIRRIRKKRLYWIIALFQKDFHIFYKQESFGRRRHNLQVNERYKYFYNRLFIKIEVKK